MIFAKNFARNYEKIILGTSNAWSMSRLSHRPIYVQSKLALKYWRKLIPKYLCFSINIANLKKNHIISRIYPFNEKCCIYSPWYNLSKSKIKSSVQFCKRESSSSLVSTGLAKLVLIVNLDCMSRLWQYGMWSFQTGGTKLERFLPKNQHTQRKLLNFENWVNGEVSKSAKIWLQSQF